MSGSGPPVVHVYAVCHNEETLLPHFLRYYEALAERIIVFEDGSTDRSAEILRAHPAVRLVHSDEVPSQDGGKYSERILMGIRNEAYKESRGRADWVIVADIDEFVHHPDLRGLLDRYRRMGVTFPKVKGYDMVADGLPANGTPLTEHSRTGFANPWYCKNAVFDPRIDINYKFGCHKCSPAGPVVESGSPEIKLLHYRFLGPGHFARKYGLRSARMSWESRMNNWGTVVGVPGKAGAKPIDGLTAKELESRYGEILAEQRIETVLP